MTQLGFVGTYTDSDSDGVYTVAVRPDEDPVIRRIGATDVPDDPSFLAVHPDGSALYAVHEVAEGAVSAFRIDEESRTDVPEGDERTGGDGGLSHLNRVRTGGGGAPCHCSVHPSGEYVFVAHYNGATVTVHPVRDDYGLERPIDTVAREGSGADPDRQASPHPHSATPGPDGQYVYVPDLGTDEIGVYEFDDSEGMLQETGCTEVSPGAGPRHIDFHPTEPYAYVSTELDSTVTAFKHDPETGGLSETATRTTLPDGDVAENYPGDIRVHPSGEYLYASNRGHDSIVAFDIDGDPSDPSPIGHYHTGGEWPRHFALDGSGQWLFAENQHTDDIVAFRIDRSTGELEPTGTAINVPSPTCMCLLER
ncbi:lactonase family protein [Halosimplex marinum]|uniref:lactonase family protein n=1 Tax=Halosimplex marinum TaxID=3396620 RepID=UPI003F552E1C